MDFYVPTATAASWILLVKIFKEKMVIMAEENSVVTYGCVSAGAQNVEAALGRQRLRAADDALGAVYYAAPRREPIGVPRGLLEERVTGQRHFEIKYAQQRRLRC